MDTITKALGNRSPARVRHLLALRKRMLVKEAPDGPVVLLAAKHSYVSHVSTEEALLRCELGAMMYALMCSWLAAFQCGIKTEIFVTERPYDMTWLIGLRTA